LIVSIPETFEAATVEAATEPEMFRVSLPRPPSKVSVVLNVAFAAVAVAFPALNVSSPEPPVKADPPSIPVVSVIASYSAISLQVKDLRAF